MNVELLDEALTEIAEYSATEAGLADLRERMANVEYDVSTVKGMAVAKADRAEVRGLRTGLENMRKSIKAPALAHCKLIDDEAKRITAALLEIEEPIDAQIKAREAVLEAERAARELAERERITAIHQNIADIREYVALALACRTSERIQALQDKLAGMDVSGFDEFTDEAMAALHATGKRVEDILTEKIASEAEAARVRAEQAAAAAQLIKERAELAEQQAAARREQKRLDDEAKARRDAEQAVIDERNAKDAAELAAARESLAAQARQVAEAQARIDEVARKEQEAKDLSAYQAAVAPVVVQPCVAYTEADFEAGHTQESQQLPATVSCDCEGSCDDSMASAQIEYDQSIYYKTSAPSSADIFAMCMESNTADQFAKWLCSAAGVTFPPEAS